jgi:glycoprotein 3-alpha-L-fucosyltransferase
MKAAIPVVFGGSSRRDYDLVAPPHSFIHIEDFDDAQTLADYLHYLATNSTAYAEYFW